MAVVNRRELIDAEDFTRRRAVAALVRGDALAVSAVPRRPNAVLVGGLVLALLLAAGSAATAFLTGRAPDGWLADGSLVLDEGSGSRFVAQGGTLRPVPTLTGALLAGAKDEPLLVPHELVLSAPVGPPLPGTGLPERPPVLPFDPTGFTACTSGRGVDVFSGAPAVAPLPADGLLVRRPKDPAVVLITGRRSHRMTKEALLALGLSATPVREVPAAWLALVPPGPALTRVPAPPGPGADVPGVGKQGEVVRAAGSGRHFMVVGGTVRPLLDRTNELLAPPPVRDVPDAALQAAEQGAPVGIPGAPAEPPTVAPREDEVVACTRSSDGQVRVLSAIDDAGTRPAAPVEVRVGDAAPVAVTWHFPAGQGALVGAKAVDRPRKADEAQKSPTEGIVLVSDGVAFPVADEGVLRALGYRRDQTVLLPDPWLRLLARGAALSTPVAAPH